MDSPLSPILFEYWRNLPEEKTEVIYGAENIIKIKTNFGQKSNTM